VQGLTYIAAVLAMCSKDGPSCFRALTVLTRSPAVLAMLRVDGAAIAAHCEAFDAFVKESDPELAASMAEAGVSSELFLFSWLQTLMTRHLPLHVALRIWDG